MMKAEPESTGCFEQVGSLFCGDELIPAIEDPPSLSLNPSDEEDIVDTFPEEEFHSSALLVLETLEATKEENHVKNHEVILCLSDSMPLCSIDSVSVLLKRILQIIVARTQTLTHNSDFVRALETVLYGLNLMKMDKYHVPPGLASIFSTPSPSSLLVALKTLLAQEEADSSNEEATESKSEQNAVDSMGVKLKITYIDAQSECSTTVALTDDMSVMRGIDSFSPTSFVPTFDEAKMVDIEALVGERAVSDITDGYKTPDPEFERDESNAREANMIPSFSSEDGEIDSDIFRKNRSIHEDLLIPELLAGQMLTEETSASESSLDKEPSSKVTVTPHYDEALQRIESIKIDLQEEEVVREQTHDITCGDKTTRVSIVERTEKATPIKTIKKPALTKKRTTNSQSSSSRFDCESTVAGSLDSIDITDDEESARSSESEETSPFNCAFDSFLEVVLGPCYLPDEDSDISVSSIESEQSSEDDDSDEEFKSSMKAVDTEPATICDDHVLPQTRGAPATCDQTSNMRYSKTSLMESDFEDSSSDEGEGEWWVRDVRGVETVSLTSF